MKSFQIERNVYIVIDAEKRINVYLNDKELTFSIKECEKWVQRQRIESVYIHFLSYTAANFILNSGLANKKLIWLMWGADFYGLPAFSDSYYLADSLPFAWKNKGAKRMIAQTIGLPSDRDVMKLLHEIDFFVGYKEEFDLVCNKISGTKMTHIPMEYYFSIEEMQKPEINQGEGYILLGNSDDPMNNHLDVLKLLNENIGESCPEIICPIAGANGKYQKALTEFVDASELKVQFLHENLSPPEFFKILDKVSYVVYGHLRQQGVGTLLPLLYQGKKVFLWETNPLYSILQRWNINVTELDALEVESFTKLEMWEVVRRREEMDKVFSQAANEERWEKILNI